MDLMIISQHFCDFPDYYAASRGIVGEKAEIAFCENYCIVISAHFANDSVNEVSSSVSLNNNITYAHLL